jgi:hypothetical protein
VHSVPVMDTHNAYDCNTNLNRISNSVFVSNEHLRKCTEGAEKRQAVFSWYICESLQGAPAMMATCA